MLMKRFFAIAMAALALATIAPQQVSAQYYNGIDMKGKVIVGGNLGFGMTQTSGWSYINGELSPQIGYRLTDQLEAGTRIVYHLEYAKEVSDPNSTANSSSVSKESVNYVGLSPYISFEFWRGLYVQAEYEGVYGFARKIEDGQTTKDGQWYNSLPVGIGYRYYMGESGFAYIAGFYNVFNFVDSSTHAWSVSPYNSPWLLRLGFCWGF